MHCFFLLSKYRRISINPSVVPDVLTEKNKHVYSPILFKLCHFPLKACKKTHTHKVSLKRSKRLELCSLTIAVTNNID